jgi:hypothetical protein
MQVDSRFLMTRTRDLIVMATALCVLVACGGDSGDPQESVPSNRRTESTDQNDVTSPPPCTELFADGVRADASSEAISEGASCTQNGTEEVIRSQTRACADGRTMIYNNYGWGFDGAAWHATSAADAAIAVTQMCGSTTGQTTTSTAGPRPPTPA